MIVRPVPGTDPEDDCHTRLASGKDTIYRLLIGSTRFAIIALVLLTVHLAIGLGTGDFAISKDGPEYIRMAENMLAGNGFSYDGVHPVVGKTPGLSGVVAGYLWAFGTITGFHFLQLVLLFASYFAIARLAGLAFGGTAGVLTLTILVAVEPLRGLAENVMTEPLFLALFGFGLLVVYLSFRVRSNALAVVAGVLFGLATYVRPIGLFWPMGVLVLIWAMDRRFVRMALVVTAAHSIVVGPWIVRNVIQFDRLIPMVANWGPLYGMTEETLWKSFYSAGWESVFADTKFRELIGSEFPYNWAPQERLRTATLSRISSDRSGWILRCMSQSAQSWTYLPSTREWYENRPTIFWIGRVIMIVFYLVCLLGALFHAKRDSLVVAILGGHMIYSAVMLFPVTTEGRYLVPVYVYLIPLFVAGLIQGIPSLRLSWGRSDTLRHWA
jgi:hypothetical protein